MLSRGVPRPLARHATLARSARLSLARRVRALAASPETKMPPADQQIPTAHLVELISLLPVTTCPKRSEIGGTSWKLSCARARALARVSERSRVISIGE